jgi:hypothetical protein
MVDSNCLDHFHIEQMVQNEDDEILKVMKNKEEIYKITFADSQRSTDMESLLRVTSSKLSQNSAIRRSSNQGINLYNKGISPSKKVPSHHGQKRRSYSPFKTPKYPSMSPNKKAYKYVYEGKEFKKISIDESQDEEFDEFEGNQWRNKFKRFKMETTEDMNLNQSSMENDNFEADVSEEEYGNEKYHYNEENSFENSFENSD